ncbi:NAD(P)/FAD-dependent oxidoreductase [Serratia sp. NPDC078593]|uniref:NAD(P)/FAD-dependent oxidoreductase n=1 Tax=unclassified Serratia (in: enterobacteria) TaxID=2647522 RepID=UPI0037D22FCC
MKNKDDIAIVGGGIIGTVIAREIVNHYPQANVTLIEKRFCGAGSSFYSAGVHFPRGMSERVREMSRYSHDYYQPFICEGAPFYALPMTLITAQAQKEETLESYLPLAEFTPAATRDPALCFSQEEHCVLQGQGAHYADVFAVVQKWLLTLRPQLTVREGLSVQTLEPQTGGYRITLSDGSVLNAGQVILAPGPWVAAPAWRERIAGLGIRVKKVVAVHIERQPEPDAALTILHDEDAFLLPCHSRGHWLFSYTCQEWDVLPEQAGPLEARDLDKAREILSRYAPALAAQIKDGRVFCDAYSPSREPVIVRLDEHLIFAGGANGSGYRLAPAIAADVTQLLTQTAF